MMYSSPYSKIKARNLKLILFFTILCGLSIFSYYFYFLLQLINYEFALSIEEGKNLYYTNISDLAFQGNNIFYSLFLKIFTLITKDFFIFRIISFFALFALIYKFFKLNTKEKVLPIFSFISILLFLSLTLTQINSIQAVPYIFALFLDLLGLSLYFSLNNEDSQLIRIFKSLFIYLFFILGLVLTDKLTFLCFPLFLLINFNKSKNLTIITMASVILILFIKSLFFNNYLSWKLLNLFSNLNWLIESWSLLTILIVLSPFMPYKNMNIKHPAIFIFVVATILSIIDSGFDNNSSGIWLISAFAFSWITALSLNYIYNKKSNSLIINFLPIFLILLLIQTPILGNPLLVKLSKNSALIKSTNFWLEEKENKKLEILELPTQDMSLALFTKSKAIDLYKISKEDLENKKFKYIVLKNKTDLNISPELLNLIYENYSPLYRLIVATEEGFLYVRKTDKYNINEISEAHNVFATFYPNN